MTREEANNYGTEWLKDECLDAKDREFIKMALEVLKQEPSWDLISREATLKPYKGLNDEDTISVWLIRKNIEEQPLVNVRYPTGNSTSHEK